MSVSTDPLLEDPSSRFAANRGFWAILEASIAPAGCRSGPSRSRLTAGPLVLSIRGIQLTASLSSARHAPRNCQLKGGTGKTTSTIYLGCALAQSGSVVVVDADPQGSAALWAENAPDLPFSTVAVPSPAVARQPRDLADRYDHLIIDTPPGHPGITSAALAAVDVELVPVTTGSVDLVGYSATVEIIEAPQASPCSSRPAPARRRVSQVTPRGVAIVALHFPRRDLPAASSTAPGRRYLAPHSVVSVGTAQSKAGPSGGSQQLP